MQEFQPGDGIEISHPTSYVWALRPLGVGDTVVLRVGPCSLVGLVRWLAGWLTVCRLQDETRVVKMVVSDTGLSLKYVVGDGGVGWLRGRLHNSPLIVVSVCSAPFSSDLISSTQFHCLQLPRKKLDDREKEVREVFGCDRLCPPWLSRIRATECFDRPVVFPLGACLFSASS
jgi:hypothetical protein